jgi:hypothetical protein
MNQTPMVKLAPLPCRAQFLNVIESVFNGMSVSIIHNSDYESVDTAKAAIDRYFRERNKYFKKTLSEPAIKSGAMNWFPANLANLTTARIRS